MTDAASTPTPPPSLPDDLAATLRHQNAGTLDAIANYAQALAAAQREAEPSAETDRTDAFTDEPSDVADDAPAEEVPGKATVVTKTIKGHEYEYWQWRDGDHIKSKYKAPVNPDD
jgi:hypothetical protein